MQWAPRAEQIEEIVDLAGGDPRRSSISSRRARRVTAGDARVLSMASERAQRLTVRMGFN
jgi:hypothetical protein